MDYEREKFNKKKLALILKKVALNQNLKSKEYKILLFLLPELRKGKYVEISQAEISRQTGMNPSQVSKAIRTLYREKILIYDISDTAWRKEICLVVNSFEEIENEIYELISQNTGKYLDDDDDDDDDDEL